MTQLSTTLLFQASQPSFRGGGRVLRTIRMGQARLFFSFNHLFYLQTCTNIIIILLMTTPHSQHHAKNMKRFAITLALLQVIIAVIYGVFVRIQKPDKISSTLNSERYPAFQDVNVMMLIGFGYLMAFSRSFSWSAITYTFFMNAILVQLYLLLTPLWKNVLVEHFHQYNIFITEPSLTSALYSAASMFVSLGCFVGRVGPLECLILCIVHEVGYTLNEVIVLDLVKAFDVGGSFLIHAFGAYSGLTTSMILGAICRPRAEKPAVSYYSTILALIGTLFLWMFWPSFNFGYFSSTPFQKSQVIVNTLLSLTGSCLATFATNAFLKNKFIMEYLMNATLAGGVVIGASSGLLINPGAALAIGLLTGVISTMGYQYLTPYLEHKLGLFDTCGVHNLHGIPGLLGGIISSIVVASFHSNYSDSYPIDSTQFSSYGKIMQDPFKQGGLQIAGTLISIVIGIATALVGGIIIRFIYRFKQDEFFTDAVYFEEADKLIEELAPLNVYQDTTKRQVGKDFNKSASFQVIVTSNK